MAAPPRAEIAVIGGSGFYEFLESPIDVEVETPYGPPTAPVAIGYLAAAAIGDTGRAVAFLPRHGRQHEYPPHRVNYRANLWALRSVGVRRVLAPCAVGSLQPELGPGDIAIPDQLVDRTTGRVQTFMDKGAVHVAFSDPYCPALRASLVETGSGRSVIEGGTMVVVDGPRFTTRAESQWYAAQGWSLINMTGHPEAVLARELALCYASIALVTDRDAGIGSDDAVSQAEVFAEFARNIERLRGLLVDVIDGLPAGRETCACAQTLDGLTPPFELP